jgi:hypothetical protein
VGIDRVPFDVMRDPIKRPVFLHRIGSKSVLINSTFTRRAVVSAQPDGMSGGQPMEGLADLFAGFRLKKEMPMVGHNAEGEKAKGKLLEHLFQADFKADVVRDGVIDGDLAGRPIADMKRLLAWDLSGSAWHKGLDSEF